MNSSFLQGQFVLYILVEDSDLSDSSEVVDRIYVEPSGDVSPGSGFNSVTMSGIYDNAVMVLSYAVKCRGGFTGVNCTGNQIHIPMQWRI